MGNNYFTPFGAEAPRMVEVPKSTCNPWTYRSVLIAWCASAILATVLMGHLALQVVHATADLDQQIAMAARI